MRPAAGGTQRCGQERRHFTGAGTPPPPAFFPFPTASTATLGSFATSNTKHWSLDFAPRTQHRRRPHHQHTTTNDPPFLRTSVNFFPGMVVITSTSFSLWRIVVLPPASSPIIEIILSVSPVITRVPGPDALVASTDVKIILADVPSTCNIRALLFLMRTSSRKRRPLLEYKGASNCASSSPS